MPGKHFQEKEEKKKQRGKNHVSCIVATFRSFTGKEKRAGNKETDWVCLEKCCTRRRGEEKPDAAPLILYTSADLWATHST